MAISIDWNLKIIYVPKADLTFISTNLYELDVNNFRLQLKALEESDIGILFPDTHRHNTEVTLSGVTYARQVEIINGYTVTFEDGTYTVRCVGANHNIADVKNINSVSLIIGNSAGLIVTNFSGSPSGPTVGQIADEVWNRLSSLHTAPNTFGGLINLINTSTQNILNAQQGSDLKLDLIIAKSDDILIDTDNLINSMSLCLDIINTILKFNANRTRIDKNTKTLIVYDDDGVTPIKTFNLKNFDGVASITEMAERDPQ